ncbi:unnamed protein product [Cunninghamella echinulata]
MVRAISIALSIIAAAALVKSNEHPSPPVELSLVTPWVAPNSLIEIAETFGKQHDNIIDFISDLLTIKTSEPHLQYKEALEIANKYLDTEQLDILKFQLSTHSAAPIIEAHHQYYNQIVLPTITNYDPNCEVWAQIGSHQACTLNDLQHYLTSMDFEKKQVHTKLEHIYCPQSCHHDLPQVNVYTSSIGPEFNVFHQHLLNTIQEHGSLKYSLRFKPSSSSSHQQQQHDHPLYLSGYGVELTLKNTDYLVIDDRTTKENAEDKTKADSSSNPNQSLNYNNKKGNQVLFESNQVPTIEPLTQDEIKPLGMQAAQFIVSSENPLSALTHLSQDFPKYGKKLTAIEVDKDLEQEISFNQHHYVQAGTNVLWVNGIKLEDDEVNPFFLSRALQREKSLLKSLVQLGGNRKQALELLSSSILETDSSNKEQETIQGVYDVRDKSDEPSVIWWNDLETDSKYKQWSSDLTGLLRPTYPGQLRPIRRNLFNLIFVEDLANPKSLQRLTNDVKNMVRQGTPLRFGLLTYLGEYNSPSSLASKALRYFENQHGKHAAMTFLEEISTELSSKDESYATEEIISTAFNNAQASIKKSKTHEKLQWSDIKELKHTSSVEDLLKRMGLQQLNKDGGVLFLNGQYLEYNDENPWSRVLMGALNLQTHILAKSVYLGELHDNDNVYDFLLNQNYVSSSRNPYIAITENRPLIMLDFNNDNNNNDIYDQIPYYHNGKNSTITTNLWVVGNVNAPSGIKLALNAIEFIESNEEVRLSILHSPSSEPFVENQSQFSDILYQALYVNNTDLETLKTILKAELQHWQDYKNGNDQFNKNSEIKPLAPGSPIVESNTKKNAENQWISLASVLYYEENDQKLKHLSNGNGVVINGRVIGPFDDDVEFSFDDFTHLWELENDGRITPMVEALKQVNWPTSSNDNDNSLPNTITKIRSILEKNKDNNERNILLSQESNPTREKYYEKLIDKHSRIHINKQSSNDNDDAYAEIVALLDPLSEKAQKWSVILNVLSELQGVTVDIYLNPQPRLEELPLKRFYRYVLDFGWQFDEGENNLRQRIPTAYFDDLPVDALYTLGVETIEPWHVTVREANVDLDNIQLASLIKKDPLFIQKGGVSAVYELERILIEGHCVDGQHPPRGLQFILGTESQPATTDTIVMANLGYFQLKAQPGIWQLQLRPGRSSEVYNVESIGLKGKWIKSSSSSEKVENEIATTSTSQIILDSFEGLRLFVSVKKNHGMENEDVLETGSTQEHEKEGIFSTLTQKIFGKKDDNSKPLITKKPQADINIFSVASGHLYERFLAIMMASVMEHTDSSVKFWFIENFLSPSFKDFVPELSKKFGFEYEMVTYKWPSWLNAQKEKQRTIWGYKILFLDVLFPLDLDKVIFVDADQIVRTDLQELVDLDLHGAPYGYTPFCSDRHEMDGFRFWDQGYWKEHLRGRPYHISALYVVDLVRFRQLAAGDRLRAQYQQLSADPHSLANLDQDLPNNMIHTVPIYSLPQEWLWCETWCSDESLKKAKTIDLCNNPLTKEPKLDRARRQVPEWEAYDTKIETIRQQFIHNQQQKQDEQKDNVIKAPTSEPSSFEHIKDEL